jgi:hypothetical protein
VIELRGAIRILSSFEFRFRVLCQVALVTNGIRERSLVVQEPIRDGLCINLPVFAILAVELHALEVERLGLARCIGTSQIAQRELLSQLLELWDVHHLHGLGLIV